MRVKTKGKVDPMPFFNWIPGHDGVLGWSAGLAPLILDLGTRWGEWSASLPCRFTPRKRAPGTHWIGKSAFICLWATCGSRAGRRYEFFPSPPRPDRLWFPHNLLYPQGLPWGKSSRVLKLTTHLKLVPRSRMRGAIPSHPGTPSWRGAHWKKKYKDRFTLNFVFYENDTGMAWR
jgi:hypothetical protein